MKFPPLLFAASLAANVALAIALFRSPAVRNYFSSPPPAAAASPTHTAVPPKANAPAEASASEESWAQLASANLPELVARLRADGVHPRLLRLIVSALISQRFADRHKAIVDAMTAKPWWQGQAYEAYSDPKITALRRQLGRDEHNALYEILGPEQPASDYDRLWVERRYGSLSPDKVERLRQTNADYDDLMAELRDQAYGIILPEDRAKLAYLEQEKRNDIAKLLTPDELLDLNLHSGPTANSLRNRLAAFDPTEEEYRALFKIQQSVDAQFGDGKNQNLTQEERRLRRDLSNATGEQVRAVLSPERFADYQLKTDPAYLQTSQFVAGANLPPATTAQIVAVQKDTTTRMQAVIADKTLTGPQRTAQFATLAQQANASLSTTLGASALADYKQSNGSWLTNLEQRAQQPKK